MMMILGCLYKHDVLIAPKIDLPSLLRVAVLVDKYRWHGAATDCKGVWMMNLQASEGLPDCFGKRLLDWLWIVWVFGMKDYFEALSKVAQQDARASINLKNESIRLPVAILGE